MPLEEEKSSPYFLLGMIELVCSSPLILLCSVLILVKIGISVFGSDLKLLMFLVVVSI